MAVVGIGTRANRVFSVSVSTEVRPGQVGEGKLALGGGRPDDDEVLQLWSGVAKLAEHLEVVESSKLTGRKCDLRPRALEDVANLIVAIDRHDGQQYGTGANRR